MFKYCKKFRRFCDCIRDSIGPYEDPRYLISRCSDGFSAASLVHCDTVSIYPLIGLPELPIPFSRPHDRSRASVCPVLAVLVKSKKNTLFAVSIDFTANFHDAYLQRHMLRRTLISLRRTRQVSLPSVSGCTDTQVFGSKVSRLCV